AKMSDSIINRNHGLSGNDIHCHGKVERGIFLAYLEGENMIGEEKESTLVLGTITGYKAWNFPNGLAQYSDVDKLPWGDYSILRSCQGNVRWKVHKTTAHCLNQYKRGKGKFTHSHSEAPHPKCSCGIYAFYHPYDVLQSFHLSTSIFGAFTGWGNTILGTKGFRIQYAKICALVSSVYITPSVINHIAGYYKVPVFNNYNDLLIKFPKTDLGN